MKKIFILLFLFILYLLHIPTTTYAQDNCFQTTLQNCINIGGTNRGGGGTNVNCCISNTQPRDDSRQEQDLGPATGGDATTGEGVELGTIGGEPDSGLGPFANLGTEGNAGEAFETVISTVIGIMTIAGMLWFMAQLIIGALGWVSAGGDAKRLEAARGRITNAIVGLTIVVAAWAIIGIIGTILGLEILNPADIIDKLPTGIQ